MYNAILFDLDGTLLPLDTKRFINEYIELLINKAEEVMNREFFYERFMNGTMKMVNNEVDTKTNQDAFMEEMLKGLDEKQKKKLLDLFDEFYQQEYHQLEKVVEDDSSLSRDIIDKLLSSGYKIVIATNPVFPLTAITARMKWANIHDFEYELITSYEIMHYTKPFLKYYLEICEYIAEDPENCLMVGNDCYDDLAAKKAGMEFFLINDYIEGEKKTHLDIKPDQEGSLKEFLSFIEKKLVIS